jgi:hypothetical protein
MLQTLKEALSKTVVQGTLIALLIAGGMFFARRAQVNYEKALKDDAKAEALVAQAKVLTQLQDSIEKLTKADKARADSMLTIIRPKVVSHGEKVISKLKDAEKVIKETGDLTTVVNPTTGLPDTLITIPLFALSSIINTADSLALAYAELKFTDDSTFIDLKKVQADLEALHVTDQKIIANKDDTIKTKDDEIKHLKKARTANKIGQVAIVVGIGALYLFSHIKH